MAFRGLRQEQGSFSLYLLLAAGALFTLFLLIFNGLRYILVMQNTEQALESAAISLLSHYEPQLMQEMGIFALTEQAVSPEAAAGYFTDNLNSGAFFGSPACQRFNWRLKETERLDRLQALETQLVKSQAVEGWLNLARRLLQAVETDELRRSLRLLEELPQGEEETTKEDHLWEPLNSFPLSGPTAGERAAEESQKDEISLWHFLSPWPPGGLPKDHRLPKTLLREEGKRLDALALEPSAWSLLFEDLAAVKKQGGGLIAYGSVFSEALIQGLLEAKDKCLRIEYFMGQLDYATAAPSYDRWFEKAEVEYLICGRQSSWSNQRELAMRLFFLRALLQIGTRLAKGQAQEAVTALAVIGEGLMAAKEDVERLFAGERIPLIPFQEQLTATYQDFLRIFLLLQDKDVQLARFQTLLEANLLAWKEEGWSGETLKLAAQSGLLSAYSEGIELEAEIRFRLWPFGSLSVTRQAEAGYEKPFGLLGEAL